MLSKHDILIQLIDYYCNGNKAEFARKLGVKPQSINTWLSRDSFDIDLIYSKCELISGDWLLTGEGSMLRDSTVVSPPRSEAELKEDRLLSIIESQQDTIKELGRKIK